MRFVVCCTLLRAFGLFLLVFVCVYVLCCVFVLFVWTIMFIKTSDDPFVLVKDYGYAKGNHGNGPSISGYGLSR